jgi:hypothetical protein
VSFASLTPSDAALIMMVRSGGLEKAISEVRLLDGTGFNQLFLDLGRVGELTTGDLEALTAIAALATRRGLAPYMFNVKADVATLVHVVELADVLPVHLKARDEDDAITEAAAKAST